MPSEITLAYIAGLFDGEGNVMCKQYPRAKPPTGKVYNTWYIRAEVAMANESTIKWLHQTLGFGWCAPKRYHNKPHWKPQWRWCCGYRNCLKFAKMLAPYSKVKKEALNQVILHYENNQKLSA
jgi:hypothetical protein